MSDAGDEEPLLFAARESRTLITNNIKDFVLLHRAWLRWMGIWGVGLRHAGILIVPQVRPWQRSETAGRMNDLLALGLPGPNERYQWSQRAGWTRYEPPNLRTS